MRIATLDILNAATIVTGGLALALRAIRLAMQMPVGNAVLEPLALAAAGVAAGALGGFVLARVRGAQEVRERRASRPQIS